MEKPSGAKKMCYPALDLPLIALDELAELGKKNPMFAKLDQIVKENGGVWCTAAEKYLLANAPRID